MTAGGGIDFKVSKHVSVRPVQAEYFMTKIPDGSTTARTICGLALESLYG
jgi:hypothetical protein